MTGPSNCNPNYAQAYYNRGKALTDLKRLEEAIASYDRAIALKPDYAQAWCNRGNVLNDLENFQQALASYDKAIALKPDYAEAWSNRGTALQYLYRLEEALACHDKALALNPDYAEAHCNRGSVLNSIKRPQDALASFNRAIALNPDFAQAHFNRAITELGLGNMEDGWREFEWRRKIVEMSGNRVFPKPLLTSLDEVRRQDDSGPFRAWLWRHDTILPLSGASASGGRQDFVERTGKTGTAAVIARISDHLRQSG